MQDVERGAVGGGVGAEAGDVGGELRMHRADGDGIRPGLCGVSAKFRQGGKIADAAILFAAQRVELHGKAPAFSGVARSIGDGIGARRGDGERSRDVAQLQPVIAGLVDTGGRMRPCASLCARPSMMPPDSSVMR